jgi:HlyD family secretion protein
VHEKRWRRRIIWACLGAGLIALAWTIWRPSAIPVQTSKAIRGSMRVTVDEEGETRAHNRFIVAAPISGRMLRVELEAGDSVRENQIVAKIEPLPLNQQEREEVLARVETAEANKRQADARAERALEDYEQAQRELKRAEHLEKIISKEELEQARNKGLTSTKELEAAKFSAQAAASEVKVARAGLVGIEGGSLQPMVITIHSPVSGCVLQLVEKSERVVQAGAPLLIIGDPRNLEIVTDVLTTDAVNIKSGAPVDLQGWGGDHPLHARVRLVEPSGFTKVSALGVEEKRVNVIADFVDPPRGLGDGYRVGTSIVTWEARDVLKIPGSAAFREPDGWSVFVIEAGKARRRAIKIGHRNQTDAEVLGGLTAGDEVILHPSNQLSDRVRVQQNR